MQIRAKVYFIVVFVSEDYNHINSQSQTMYVNIRLSPRLSRHYLIQNSIMAKINMSKTINHVIITFLCNLKEKNGRQNII